jgi:hypothetical protein
VDPDLGVEMTLLKCSIFKTQDSEPDPNLFEKATATLLTTYS